MRELCDYCNREGELNNDGICSDCDTDVSIEDEDDENDLIESEIEEEI